MTAPIENKKQKTVTGGTQTVILDETETRETDDQESKFTKDSNGTNVQDEFRPGPAEDGDEKLI